MSATEQNDPLQLPTATSSLGQDAKSGATKVFVFTPSKLQELGLIAKVQDGKTFLVPVKKENASHTSRVNLEVETDAVDALSGASRGPSATYLQVGTDDKKNMHTASIYRHNPNRRRILHGFAEHWVNTIDEKGFVNCPLRQCMYISLSYDDMCEHYSMCKGTPYNTENLCQVCGRCLRSKHDLKIHLARSHSGAVKPAVNLDPPAETAAVERKPLMEPLVVRKRGYNKVHHRAWTISLENKGYVKCHFQNCIFMALDINEMIEHFRYCKGETLDNLVVCPLCQGGVLDRKRLRLHMSTSHPEVVPGSKTLQRPAYVDVDRVSDADTVSVASVCVGRMDPYPKTRGVPSRSYLGPRERTAANSTSARHVVKAEKPCASETRPVPGHVDMTPANSTPVRLASHVVKAEKPCAIETRARPVPSHVDMTPANSTPVRLASHVVKAERPCASETRPVPGHVDMTPALETKVATANNYNSQQEMSTPQQNLFERESLSICDNSQGYSETLVKKEMATLFYEEEEEAEPLLSSSQADFVPSAVQDDGLSFTISMPKCPKRYGRPAKDAAPLRHSVIRANPVTPAGAIAGQSSTSESVRLTHLAKQYGSKTRNADVQSEVQRTPQSMPSLLKRRAEGDQEPDRSPVVKEAHWKRPKLHRPRPCALFENLSQAVRLGSKGDAEDRGEMIVPDMQGDANTYSDMRQAAATSHVSGVGGVTITPDMRQVAATSHVSGVGGVTITSDMRQAAATSHVSGVGGVTITPDMRHTTATSHVSGVGGVMITPDMRHTTATSHVSGVGGVTITPDMRQTTATSHVSGVGGVMITPDMRHTTATSHVSGVGGVTITPDMRHTTATSHVSGVGGVMITPDMRHTTATSHVSGVGGVKITPDMRQTTATSHVSGVGGVKITPDMRQTTATSHVSGVGGVTITPDMRQTTATSHVSGVGGVTITPDMPVDYKNIHDRVYIFPLEEDAAQIEETVIQTEEVPWFENEPQPRILVDEVIPSRTEERTILAVGDARRLQASHTSHAIQRSVITSAAEYYQKRVKPLEHLPQADNRLLVEDNVSYSVEGLQEISTTEVSIQPVNISPSLINAHESLRIEVPAHADTLPSVGDVHESLRIEVPAHADTLPSVGDVRESLRIEVPAHADTLPSVGDVCESLRIEVPAHADIFPSVRDVRESLRIEVPAHADTLPSVGDVRESLRIDVPAHADTLPSVGDVHESLRIEVPAHADTLPSVGDVRESLRIEVPAHADTLPSVGDVFVRESLRIEVPAHADIFPSVRDVRESLRIEVHQPKFTAATPDKSLEEGLACVTEPLSLARESGEEPPLMAEEGNGVPQTALSESDYQVFRAVTHERHRQPSYHSPDMQEQVISGVRGDSNLVDEEVSQYNEIVPQIGKNEHSSANVEIQASKTEMYGNECRPKFGFEDTLDNAVSKVDSSRSPLREEPDTCDTASPAEGALFEADTSDDSLHIDEEMSATPQFEKDLAAESQNKFHLEETLPLSVEGSTHTNKSRTQIHTESSKMVGTCHVVHIGEGIRHGEKMPKNDVTSRVEESLHSIKLTSHIREIQHESRDEFSELGKQVIPVENDVQAEGEIIPGMNTVTANTCSVEGFSRSPQGVRVGSLTAMLVPQRRNDLSDGFNVGSGELISELSFEGKPQTRDRHPKSCSVHEKDVVSSSYLKQLMQENTPDVVEPVLTDDNTAVTTSVRKRGRPKRSGRRGKRASKQDDETLESDAAAANVPMSVGIGLTGKLSTDADTYTEVGTAGTLDVCSRESNDVGIINKPKSRVRLPKASGGDSIAVRIAPESLSAKKAATLVRKRGILSKSNQLIEEAVFSASPVNERLSCNVDVDAPSIPRSMSPMADHEGLKLQADVMKPAVVRKRGRPKVKGKGSEDELSLAQRMNGSLSAGEVLPGENANMELDPQNVFDVPRPKTVAGRPKSRGGRHSRAGRSRGRGRGSRTKMETPTPAVAFETEAEGNGNLVAGSDGAVSVASSEGVVTADHRVDATVVRAETPESKEDSERLEHVENNKNTRNNASPSPEQTPCNDARVRKSGRHRKKVKYDENWFSGNEAECGNEPAVMEGSPIDKSLLKLMDKKVRRKKGAVGGEVAEGAGEGVGGRADGKENTTPAGEADTTEPPVTKNARKRRPLSKKHKRRGAKTLKSAMPLLKDTEDVISLHDGVRCGKCGESMTVKQFVTHNRSRHSGLGWIVGQPEVDLSDFALVRLILNRTYKAKEKKSIVCEICGTVKKSITGFISHLESVCGKSEEEREAMRVTCELCGRVMMRSSLVVHMGTNHRGPEPIKQRTGEVELFPENYEPILKKRAAAEKAEICLLKFIDDDKASSIFEDPAVEGLRADSPTEAAKELFIKTGGVPLVTNIMVSRLRGTVLKEGFVKCRNAGCDFRATEALVMAEHIRTCALIPPISFQCTLCRFRCPEERGAVDHVMEQHITQLDRWVKPARHLLQSFQCTLCRFRCPEERGAVDHVMEQHMTQLERQGGSEYECDSDVSLEEVVSSEDDLEEFNSDQKAKNKNFSNGNYFSASLSLKKDKISNCIKFLAKERTSSVAGDKPYLPAIRWTLKFEEENYAPVLFTSLHTTVGDWSPLRAEVAAEYWPVTARSLPVASRLLENTSDLRAKSDPANTEWRSLKLFESAIVDGSPVFFAGGPVWAMAWCPLPTRLLLTTDAPVGQFLAVSCHRHMDDIFKLEKTFAGKGLIQIWAFGNLDNLKSSDAAPSLALGLAHECGTVWHMEWCPSGAYEEHAPSEGRLQRLGLLAAACSDGCVHLFSVPFPAQLPSDQLQFPVYRAECLVTLSAGLTHSRPSVDSWMCTRFSWFRGEGHRTIAGGFANGVVALWNLESTSPLLHRREGKHLTVFPYHTFQAHTSAVTAVALFPHFDCRYLMTGGSDRATKFWDLHQTGCPITSSVKGPVSDGLWLSHWLAAISSYDDGFGLGHCNAMLQPIRNFGYSSYPILAQNSPVWALSGSDWGNAMAQGTAAGELTVIFPHQLFVSVDTEKGMKNKRMVISYMELVDFDKTPKAGKSGGARPPKRKSKHSRSKTARLATEPDEASSDSDCINDETLIDLTRALSEDDNTKIVSTALSGENVKSFLKKSLNYEESDDNEEDELFADILGDSTSGGGKEDILPQRYADVRNRFGLRLCNYPTENLRKLLPEARLCMRQSDKMRQAETEMFPATCINRVSWNPNCRSYLWLASGYHCGLVRVPCVHGMHSLDVERTLQRAGAEFKRET